MKRVCLSVIMGFGLIISSCSGSSSSSETTPDLPVDPDKVEIEETIKVMAYNIHHANPPSKPDFIDINAIIRVVKAQDPDLLALQEIDVNTERSGPFNQAKEIANSLDMYFFFGKGIDYDGGEYGVAVLSKWPLSNEQVVKLPTKSGTGGEPRTLTTAMVTTPGGTEIRFGSTHLDAQSEDTNRLLQIEKIVEIGQQETTPFIIAGDFNAVPNSEVINILDYHFERTCRLCPLTSSANNPVRTIDYIVYHHPQDKFKVKIHEAIDESYASDHRPIVAEIDILE